MTTRLSPGSQGQIHTSSVVAGSARKAVQDTLLLLPSSDPAILVGPQTHVALATSSLGPYTMVKEEEASVLNGLSVGQGEAMSVEINPNRDLKSEPEVQSPAEAMASPSTEDVKPCNTRKKSSSTSPPLEARSSSASKKSSPSPTPAAANSRKPTNAAPQLIGHLPIAREEALQAFTEIQYNNYQTKALGRSKEMFESMTCDCAYEHGKSFSLQ